jgi:cytochrome c oxidase assembly protein subunit 15
MTGLATFCLIGLGGLVTSHGVGMAVPDWPNTYGYNMFLFPVSDWVGGIFYEHSHRLLASFVGLLATVLATWLWVRETGGGVRWLGALSFATVVILLGVRQMPVYLALAGLGLVMVVAGMVQAWRTGWSLRWLGVAMFSAVVVQGVLGGLRVVWAKDEIGIFHAALAQAFLLLLAVIIMMTGRGWKRLGAQLLSPQSETGVEHGPPSLRPLNWLLLATTVLIFLQLLVGATMRHQHAGLAIQDFPLAYGRVWPDTSPDAVARYNQQRIETVAQNPITAGQIRLQMIHRGVAVVIVGLVLWSAFAVRAAVPRGHELRRLARFWVVLIGIQFGLGAWTLWSNKAADIASLHVLCGALSLVTGGLLCVISRCLASSGAPEQKVAPTHLDTPFAGPEAGATVLN